MIYRATAIALIILLLAVAQTSFLNHFALLNNFWSQLANLIVLFVFMYCLFERRQARFSWLAAVWGGFLLDMFSEFFFGLWILSLIALVFTIKFFLKRYVSIPSFW